MHRVGPTRVVLVVDEEEPVRRAIASLLDFFGYRVLLASSASDALRVTSREPVDLVLTDVVMERMSGFELGAVLAAARPALPVVYMSGHPNAREHAPGVPARIEHFVRKPFTAGTLRHSLERALRCARVSTQALSLLHAGSF